jgi:hypothetical protein
MDVYTAAVKDNFLEILFRGLYAKRPTFNFLSFYILLKGPSRQIRFVWKWYSWTGLGHDMKNAGLLILKMNYPSIFNTPLKFLMYLR